MSDSVAVSGFAVVRHPDVTVAGVLHSDALPVQRLHGWYRVSEVAGAPSDLDIDAYGPDAPDLDAPKPEPTKPAKTTKEKSA